MNLFKMIFITMFFGVLTGLSMDFLPLAHNTHVALGLSTSASGVASIILLFMVFQ